MSETLLGVGARTRDGAAPDLDAEMSAARATRMEQRLADAARQAAPEPVAQRHGVRAGRVVDDGVVAPVPSAGANESATAGPAAAKDAAGPTDVDALLAERGRTHGEFGEFARRLALAWSGVLGQPVSPLQVPALMAAFKLVRAGMNPRHRDNWADAQGYAALGERLLGDGA